MKSHQKILGLLLLAVAMLGISPVAHAQNKKLVEKRAKAQKIKNMIDSQSYVFYAQSVNPMGGRQRILTADYTVEVSTAKLVSDLPYFGRAYSAPIGSAEAGIQFSSTDFRYTMQERKKGGWDIVIVPKDTPGGVQQLVLTVFDNGTAGLQVTSTNRQPISFNGYLKERKVK